MGCLQRSQTVPAAEVQQRRQREQAERGAAAAAARALGSAAPKALQRAQAADGEAALDECALCAQARPSAAAWALLWRLRLPD